MEIENKNKKFNFNKKISTLDIYKNDVPSLSLVETKKKIGFGGYGTVYDAKKIINKWPGGNKKPDNIDFIPTKDLIIKKQLCNEKFLEPYTREIYYLSLCSIATTDGIPHMPSMHYPRPAWIKRKFEENGENPIENGMEIVKNEMNLNFRCTKDLKNECCIIARKYNGKVCSILSKYDNRLTRTAILAQEFVSILLFQVITNSVHNDTHCANFLYYKTTKTPLGWFEYIFEKGTLNRKKEIRVWIKNIGYYLVIWDFGIVNNNKFGKTSDKKQFLYDYLFATRKDVIINQKIGNYFFPKKNDERFSKWYPKEKIIKKIDGVNKKVQKPLYRIHGGKSTSIKFAWWYAIKYLKKYSVDVIRIKGNFSKLKINYDDEAPDDIIESWKIPKAKYNWD